MPCGYLYCDGSEYIEQLIPAGLFSHEYNPLRLKIIHDQKEDKESQEYYEFSYGTDGGVCFVADRDTIWLGMYLRLPSDTFNSRNTFSIADEDINFSDAKWDDKYWNFWCYYDKFSSTWYFYDMEEAISWEITFSNVDHTIEQNNHFSFRLDYELNFIDVSGEYHHITGWAITDKERAD